MDRQKKRMVIVLILAIIILIGSFYDIHQKNTVPEPVSGSDSPQGPDIGEFVVCVNGAVKNPGVYKMKPGSRICDVLDKAGGFSAAAQENKINLAQPLKDGMQIYVPEKGARVSSGAPENSLASVYAGEQININTASKEELERLPGIGPVLAERIVDYRRSNGPFRSISEIKRVAGIGEAKFQKIKDSIII